MCNLCSLNPCDHFCPNNSGLEKHLYCPVCGEELGDETYVIKTKRQIAGCEHCISVVSYNKLYALFVN